MSSINKKPFWFASLILLAAVVATVPLSAMAGIIFRIQQVAPTGNIVIPATAQFAVTAESDSGSQPIQGIDFDFNLSDTAGRGGVLTSGSNTLFATALDPSEFPATTVIFSTFNNAGATITSTPTTVATFTLGTDPASVVEGTYAISLSSLLVIDQFQEVSSSQVPLTYTLAAVPEPGTLALAALAVSGVGMSHLARRRAARRRAVPADPLGSART